MFCAIRMDLFDLEDGLWQGNSVGDVAHFLCRDVEEPFTLNPVPRAT